MASKVKILLGLTTIGDSDWRGKIKELQKLKISEIALFLTGLKKSERKELYSLLKKTPVKSIPHVHLRSDMDAEEIEYLEKQYQTTFFNIHPARDYPVPDYFLEFRKKIYVENIHISPNQKEVQKFAGVCIDFAHWENAEKAKVKSYKNFRKLIAENPVGCGHVSAISNQQTFYPGYWTSYDAHDFTDLSQFDYLKKYLKYIPKILSIEVNNSLQEQLVVKKYLEKMINNS